MKRLIAPLFAVSGFLGAASCSSNPETNSAKVDPNVSTANDMTTRYAEDFAQATPAKKFFEQFIDDATYKSPSGDRWKVGDDCLADTPFDTNKGNRAIVSAIGNILVVDAQGFDKHLVFTIDESQLTPSGTNEERDFTLGVLNAQGCLFGARKVGDDDNNNVKWPKDTSGLEYTQS